MIEWPTTIGMVGLLVAILGVYQLQKINSRHIEKMQEAIEDIKKQLLTLQIKAATNNNEEK